MFSAWYDSDIYDSIMRAFCVYLLMDMPDISLLGADMRCGVLFNGLQFPF